MADFVSRSKVEFELCGGNLPEKYKAFVRRVLNDKNLVPAVDVVPVVHGRWISRETMAGQVYTVCSQCFTDFSYRPEGKESFVKIDMQGAPYCPNCGSKMDGGDPDGR